MKPKVDILECTLRDGSYLIDYQFTAEDTALIGASLDAAGFRFIEIGHGLGFRGSSPKHGVAAASDEEYLAAAERVFRKAKFGMFCIPGIARLRDLDMAVKHHIGFIRVGINVDEAKKAEPFIKKAKDLGLLTFSNLMKSYALSPVEFSKQVRLVARYGADIISVVDSAGGMLPEQVKEYVKVIKNETDARAGFHGHNNLSLAVGNSLAAIEAGADFIDASIRGIGRSAGNTQTEILLIILEKKGYRTGIDLNRTLDIGEKIIGPMIQGEKGIDAESAMLGWTLFHSGFVGIIEKYAKRHNLDVKELLKKVSDVERVHVTEEIVERVARTINPKRQTRPFRGISFDIAEYRQECQPQDVEAMAERIIENMLVMAKKACKQTVFTIAKTRDPEKEFTTFPFIREGENVIIGNAEVVSEQDARKIIRKIDGCCDFILLDLPFYRALSKETTRFKSHCCPYDDAGAQIDSLLKMIIAIAPQMKFRVCVPGDNDLIRRFLAGLDSQQQKTTQDVSKADFLIGLTPYEGSIEESVIRKLKAGAVVIDAGPGSLTKKAVAMALKRGVRTYRLDMRAGLFGEIEGVLKSQVLMRQIMGVKRIKGVKVVAGGVMGRRGDIVMDSMTCPRRVIGVANGQGGLLKTAETKQFESPIKKIKQFMAEQAYQ